MAYYDTLLFRPSTTLVFVADWALGHINAVKLERDGASYKAKVTPFLKGRRSM